MTGASGLTPATDKQRLPASRRRLGVILAVALIILTADIVTKLIVVAKLTGRTVKVLGSFLELTETRNPGAAFSIGGPSETVLFTAIAVGVIVFILRASGRIGSLPWAVTLGLLLGGAMGNLTDRIFRYPGLFRGYVVDWVELPHWPVFNVADSSIVCGGVLAVLLTLRGVHLGGPGAHEPFDSDTGVGSSDEPGGPAGRRGGGGA